MSRVTLRKASVNVCQVHLDSAPVKLESTENSQGSTYCGLASDFPLSSQSRCCPLLGLLGISEGRTF